MPANAVVDLGGRRGVFTPLNETAVFRALDLGTEQKDLVEILGGLAEGDTVITTGSSALRDGDRIVLPDGAGGRGRRGGATRAGHRRPRRRHGRRGAGARRDGAPARAADGARRAGSREAARAKAVRRRGRAPGGGGREGVAAARRRRHRPRRHRRRSQDQFSRSPTGYPT